MDDLCRRGDTRRQQIAEGDAREYSPAWRLRHGRDILDDDEAEAAASQIEHQDQARACRRLARKELNTPPGRRHSQSGFCILSSGRGYAATLYRAERR